MKSIGESAFYSCTGLTSITIPNSVTSIGSSAFEYCSGLTSVTIPNSVTSISDGAFAGCSGLTSVTIPNSVTRIASKAFQGCSGLSSVTLNANAIVSKKYTSSDNLKNIFGEQVKEYNIGDDVTSIGSYAFFGCSGLTSLTFPNGVISIGEKAFEGCSSLTAVNISDIEKWSQIGFGNNSANPLCYAKRLYLNGEEVTKLNLVNDVTDYAFINCLGLTEVDVKGVGISAFDGCPNIASVKVDCGTVENWFADSKAKVQTLTLGESVTTINSNSFNGFSALKTVYLGSNVATIGEKAFANCGKMDDVYCYAVNYPNVERNTFENSYLDYVTLHVPAESLNNYKNHETWGKFKAVVPIDGIGTNIKRITMKNDSGNAPVIYNLKGQRINRAAKGLNIINGRQVVIK